MEKVSDTIVTDWVVQMQVKWIKICTDVFDDEKIVLIESMPEADSIIVIWFKLLCLAGKQNNGGVMMLNDRIAYTDEMLSVIFRRPINIVRLALQTFESFEMVEVVRGAYTIPNWDKHQSLDAYEKKKQKDRERIAQKRAEKKALIASETDMSHDILRQVAESRIVEEERDKDKEEDNKDKKKKSSFVDVILSEIADDDLRNLYYEYVAMRKAIKSPITTERALKMFIKKVNSLEPTDIERQKKMLENAIVGNWKSVYPLKDDVKPTTSTASYDLDEFEERSLHGTLKYERKHK